MSLSVLPARLHRNDPGASTFSALVTDPDGLQDVVGGRLVDPVSGGTYGVFTASGASGAYTFALDWLTMQAVRGVTAAGVDGLERDFRAEFFDLAGNVGSATVTMLLHCGLTGYGVCNNQCRQLGTATNCSTCDEAVPVGGVCTNYEPRCPTGRTNCNGTCVDLQNDTNNCGTCGTVVPSGRICRNGAPACVNAAETWCPAQNVCANLQTSASHCGACGTTVAAPRTCVNGAPNCPNAGETFCSTQNVCANLQTNSAHCGTCGNAVTRGCVAGAITPQWSVAHDPVTSGTPAPAGRFSTRMVYDTSRSAMVLFGGRTDSGTYFNDTWTWNGTAWTQLMPATSPAARSFHGMAYDTVRNRVVLYGGYNGSAYVTDLWELGPAGWELRTQAGTLPDQADATSLVWDSVRQRVVVTRLRTGALWEWDGTTWTARAFTGTLVAPNAISGFDPVRNRLQLVDNTGMRVFNNSWNLAAGGGPQQATGDIAFDTVRNRSIIVALGPAGTTTSQTWEWSGSSWTAMNTHLPTRPKAVGAPAIAWDPVRQTMVLFGGLDCRTSTTPCTDERLTWEYRQ